VYGSSADLEQARAWYEKAIALGSREAPQRLQLLVSESR
jgi:TPR repeat protein